MLRLLLLLCVSSLFSLTGAEGILSVPEIKPLEQDQFDCEVYPVTARDAADGPRILAVVAHPDDECGFAATLFKTSTHLNGICDIAMITNGEGGFKYSTLAEALYGRALTEEEVGRLQLPAIRKKEFLAGCKIMQIRNAYMFMEKDHRYTTDVNEILGPDATVWNIKRIQNTLSKIMLANRYDMVVVFTPVPKTHAHHKCASILAIRSVHALPAEQRPIILGQRSHTKDVAMDAYMELEGFPETKYADQDPFIFDRTQPFGYKQRLNYKIIVNWVIAEHKSQGTMQLLMHKGDEEWYYPFINNDPDKLKEIQNVFEQLAQPQFPEKTYGPSAGAPRPK